MKKVNTAAAKATKNLHDHKLTMTPTSLLMEGKRSLTSLNAPYDTADKNA
jgi:hypothetical protein